MDQYLNQMQDIIEHGTDKGDRTGTGTCSVFGRMMRFNLADGFPLLTTKKVFFKGVVHELLWFLNGDTNNKALNENGVKIWDEWALENGDLGPIYSKQWVAWDDTRVVFQSEVDTYLELGYLWIGGYSRGGDGQEMAVVHRTINQIQNAIDALKKTPDSRRIIVSAWNPADLPDESISPQENVKLGKAALPACHTLFQFYTEEMSVFERMDQLTPEEVMWFNGEREHRGVVNNLTREGELLDEINVPRRRLSCLMFQRSQDTVLGAPFNIASYALLTSMIAHQCNMAVGDYIHVTGDAHLYHDHLRDESIVREQLSRTPRQLPQLRFNRKPESIFDYRFEDIELVGYDPHPAIKAKVSV